MRTVENMYLEQNSHHIITHYANTWGLMISPLFFSIMVSSHLEFP